MTNSDRPKPELFRRFEVFDGLTAEDLDRVADCAELRTLAEGATVMEEGENDRNLYCLLEGRVEVVKKDLSGGHERLTVLEPTSVFGELGLAVGAPRTATVRTTEESRFLFVDGAEFHELQKAQEPAAYKVEHNILRIMARRLSDSNRRVLGDLVEES